MTELLFGANSLVSISYEWTDGTHWRSQATGFLYGRLLDASRGQYDVYLVTNQHCFQLDNGQMYPSVLVSMNPRNESQAAVIAELPLVEKGVPLWTSIPGVDIAVLRMGLRELNSLNLDYVFFQSDVHPMKVQQFFDLGCIEGEALFILGFEAGVPELRRNHPIRRSGSIARIRDLYEGDSSFFMAEATVFPGNSGGPVFLAPSSTLVQANNFSFPPLIGVVSGYWPYAAETLDSSGRKQNTYYQQNRGLCCVWPVDYVEHTIDLHVERFGSLG